MRKGLITSLALILCLSIFAGCSNDSGSEEKNESTSVNTSKADSTKEGSKESDLKKVDPKETKPAESTDELLECDWTLQVDQTIPVTTDGMTVNYTLVLIAQKNGGTDVIGDYKGSAYIEISLDASKLSNEVIQVTGGFNVNASTNNLELQLVPYDIEGYSSYGLGKDDIPLAPLVKYETMALISPEMSGGGVLNPMVQGIQGEKAEVNESASQTIPMPMKITVMGGQVRVDVPSFKIGKNFEGMVLGAPVGSEEGNKKYDEMMKKIDELITELEK